LTVPYFEEVNAMPFSLEMLLDYFAVYNERIWPMQLLGYVAGLLTLVPLFRSGKAWNRAVTGVLALLWLWVSLVFWLQAASEMALLYAPTVLFAVQGALFLNALARDRITYGQAGRVHTTVGLAFTAYALVGYPLIGLSVGHTYPHTALSPLFPCPATILTFGVLLLARRVPRHLLVIPTFWAVSGALWLYLGMVEDAGLVIAGIVGAIMLAARERAAQRAASAASQV
jgi:hypothetical protein